MLSGLVPSFEPRLLVVVEPGPRRDDIDVEKKAEEDERGEVKQGPFPFLPPPPSFLAPVLDILIRAAQGHSESLLQMPPSLLFCPAHPYLCAPDPARAMAPLVKECADGSERASDAFKLDLTSLRRLILVSTASSEEVAAVKDLKKAMTSAGSGTCQMWKRMSKPGGQSQRAPPRP
eukprot:927241-Pyramimonas_sp.AAC.1